MSTASNTAHQGLFMESELLTPPTLSVAHFLQALTKMLHHYSPYILGINVYWDSSIDLDGSGGFMGDLVFNGGT